MKQEEKLPLSNIKLKNIFENAQTEKCQPAKTLNHQNGLTSPKMFHHLEYSTDMNLSSRRYVKSSQGYRNQKMNAKGNKKSMKMNISTVTFSSNLDHIEKNNQDFDNYGKNFAIVSQNNCLSQQLQTFNNKVCSLGSRSLYLRKNSLKEPFIREKHQNNSQQANLNYIPSKIFPVRKNSSKLKTRFNSFSNSIPRASKVEGAIDISVLLEKMKSMAKGSSSPIMQNKKIQEKLKQGKQGKIQIKNSRVPKMMYFQNPSYRNDPLFQKFFRKQNLY